jgi:hypothetical protein
MSVGEGTWRDVQDWTRKHLQENSGQFEIFRSRVIHNIGRLEWRLSYFRVKRGSYTDPWVNSDTIFYKLSLSVQVNAGKAPEAVHENRLFLILYRSRSPSKLSTSLKTRLEGRTGESYWRCVPKLSINFEEILWRPHGNFEEQNMFLESSTIIINSCIIITAIYYNYVINP